MTWIHFSQCSAPHLYFLFVKKSLPRWCSCTNLYSLSGDQQYWPIRHLSSMQTEWIYSRESVFWMDVKLRNSWPFNYCIGQKSTIWIFCLNLSYEWQKEIKEGSNRERNRQSMDIWQIQMAWGLFFWLTKDIYFVYNFLNNFNHEKNVRWLYTSLKSNSFYLLKETSFW